MGHSDLMSIREPQKRKHKRRRDGRECREGNKGMRRPKLMDMLRSCKRVLWTSKVLLSLPLSFSLTHVRSVTADRGTAVVENGLDSTSAHDHWVRDGEEKIRESKHASADLPCTTVPRAYPIKGIPAVQVKRRLQVPHRSASSLSVIVLYGIHGVSSGA